MKKVKITFIEDLHGLKEFYPWQVKQLKVLKPHAVLLEMLPCEKEFIDLCEQLSQGRISVAEFGKKTRWEKHWGTFEGYGLLIKYLHNSNLIIFPIDQKLKNRQELAQNEKQIILNLQKGKQAKPLVDKSRVELLLLREAIFGRNILNLVKTKKVEKLAVLVGGNHTKRMVDFFNSLDEFEAKEKRMSRQKN